MSQDIKELTKWIVDEEEEFISGDTVEVILTTGEKVMGEISYLSGDYMSLESEKLGDVNFNLEDVEEINHISLDN